MHPSSVFYLWLYVGTNADNIPLDHLAQACLVSREANSIAQWRMRAKKRIFDKWKFPFARAFRYRVLNSAARGYSARTIVYPTWRLLDSVSSLSMDQSVVTGLQSSYTENGICAFADFHLIARAPMDFFFCLFAQINNETIPLLTKPITTADYQLISEQDFPIAPSSRSLNTPPGPNHNPVGDYILHMNLPTQYSPVGFVGEFKITDLRFLFNIRNPRFHSDETVINNMDVLYLFSHMIVNFKFIPTGVSCPREFEINFTGSSSPDRDILIKPFLRLKENTG